MGCRVYGVGCRVKGVGEGAGDGDVRLVREEDHMQNL